MNQREKTKFPCVKLPNNLLYVDYVPSRVQSLIEAGEDLGSVEKLG